VFALVNAAGIASMNLLVTTPVSTIQRIVEVNLLGTIYCCQAVAPALIRSGGGRIVNFSTIAVALGLAGESVYAASKAGVEGFLARVRPRDGRLQRHGERDRARTDRHGLDRQGAAREDSGDCRSAGCPRPRRLQRICGTSSACCCLRKGRMISGQVLHLGGAVKSIIDELAGKYADGREPFLIGPGGSLCFADIDQSQDLDLSAVKRGDVVALVGDFDARSIATMLRLIDRNAVVVPLTEDTEPQHPYFCEQGRRDDHDSRGSRSRGTTRLARRTHCLEELRRRGNPGLILFSSGSTGRPKAILHDLSHFLTRYRTPRPTWRTLAFLRFDHIGGINTLLHTLFNRGVLIVPSARTPEGILDEVRRFDVELLPTTPTFLRMLLLADLVSAASLPSLRVITYGTERMNPADARSPDTTPAQHRFPADLRHVRTGDSPCQVTRTDSLWIQIGGEGVETRIVDRVLQIRSPHRMLGYLNAPDPFVDGWYDTGDLADEDAGFIRIVGRSRDVINVGGLKVLPSEIERVALLHPEMVRAKAAGAENPVTGQHIEVTCQLTSRLRGRSAGAARSFRPPAASRLPAAAHPDRRGPDQSSVQTGMTLVRPAVPRSTKVSVVIPAYDAARTICRAVDSALIGLGVEDTFLSRIIEELSGRHRRLVAKYVPTDRNGPARNLLPSHGFTPADSDAWELALS
jgi:hypothetical protein